jgi:hypothetical protein
MTAADFRRIAGFSCRRQEICFAGLASRGYGNLMLTLEQQAAFVEEAPEIFSPIPGGWGKMGHTHIPLPASEDVLTGALRTAWRLRIDKNAKTSRKNPCGGAQRSNR